MKKFKKRKNLNILCFALVIIFCLFTTWLIHPFSKSQETVEISCNAWNDENQNNFYMSFIIESDEDGKKYIVLPEQADGKDVQNYYIINNDTDEVEMLIPGDTYYLPTSSETLEDIQNEEISEDTDEVNQNQEEEFPSGESGEKALENLDEENKDPETEETPVEETKTVPNIEIEVVYVEEASEIMMLAATEPENITFSGGDGSTENPYRISTKEDMFNLAYVINEYKKIGNTSDYYTHKNYILINDIDLENDDWSPIGKTPSVGNERDYILNRTFQGNFNGNGYTIKNVNINITENLNYKSKYGLFGGIYSENPSSRAVVCNLEIENIHINVSYESIAEKDLAIGSVSGTIGQYSSIINCIVKNASIEVPQTFSMGTDKMLAIGGIVGDASVNPSEADGYGAFGAGDARYKIENCFAEANIEVSDSTWPSATIASNAYYQYNIGGIIGRIRNTNIFPQNCIYKGTIVSTKAFIGPIYGCARWDTSGDRSNFDKTYAGFSNANVSMEALVNGYFYNYQIRNIPITGTSVLTPIQIANTSHTVYVMGNDYMERVQGINRGEVISNLSEKLSMLNAYNGVGTNYSMWYYNPASDNYSFNFNAFNINKVKDLEYEAIVSDTEPSDTIVYKWSLGEELIQSGTSNKITLSPSLETRYLKLEVIVNGVSMGVKIEEVGANVGEANITKISENDQNELQLELVSDCNLELEDYYIQWYISNNNDWEILTGETSDSLILQNDSDEYMKYRAILTHKTNNELDLIATYIESNIVFVNNSSTVTASNDQTYNVGDDSNDGMSPEKAVKTLNAAYKILKENNSAENNTIVIMGNYLSSISEGELRKQAKITSQHDSINYYGKLYLDISTFLNANTIFKNITLYSKTSEPTYIYCQNNDLTMDEGIVLENFSTIEGQYFNFGQLNSNYPNFHIFGGYLDYTGQIKERTSNIIIKSGMYARVVAGSRAYYVRDVYGSALTHANINIEVDCNTEYTPYAGNIAVLVGGQSDGSCYINSNITIKNGKVDRLIGGNLGYGATLDGKPADTFFGSTELNIIGGEITEIYGGSLGRNAGTTYFYGKICMNISGGNVLNNVYGVGAGGVTGYSESSSDPYKSWALNTKMIDLDGNMYDLDKTTIEINISNSANIIGNVYGGGYGYSNYLTNEQISNDGGFLYGNTTINITGGTIEGSVYGAGKGYNDYVSKKSLAQVIGNVNINISGTPNIKNNIYGGGEGVLGNSEMARVTGNISLRINSSEFSMRGEVAGTRDIFGGGNASEVNGDINLDITIGNVDNIYGAGNSGRVWGDTNVTIKEANVSGNIFGGGNESSCENVVLNLGNNARTLSSITTGGNIFGGNNESLINDTILKVKINIYTDITANIYGGCNTTGTISDEVEINLISGTVTGNIYGAGWGSNTVVGNEAPAEILINSEANTQIIDGNIYGGGNNGTVKGNVNIYLAGRMTTTTDKAIVYGGGNAGDVQGNTYIYIGENKSHVAENTMCAQTVYGGGSAGNVTGTSNINMVAGNVRTIYGGGDLGNILGADAEGIGTKISISKETENSPTVTYIYGGAHGLGAKTCHDVNIDLSQAIVNETVYGGGDIGVVEGSITIVAKECEIRNSVYGGGNRGNVLGSTNVEICNGTHVINSVYGGGNTADVGQVSASPEDDEYITNVTISGSTVGTVNGSVITGGEVFGGGNEGVVYGNTNAIVGSTDETIHTVVGSIFYAGGKGADSTSITVEGNSNSRIVGMNTDIKAYGDISLGRVTGDVNVTFDTYRLKSSSNKYKHMNGINKATNMKLNNSYVYLVNGLCEIENLYIPDGSGMMIEKNSEISGNFYGGGTIYFENFAQFAIRGDVVMEETISPQKSGPQVIEYGVTKLAFRPIKVDDEYVINGNSHIPYIQVLGNDYSNGSGFISENPIIYSIYNFYLDKNNTNRYITNCTTYAQAGEINETIYYENTEDAEDDRKYYYDNSINKYYIMAEDLDLVYIDDDGNEIANPYIGTIDSIYFVQNIVMEPTSIVVDINSKEDKIYTSQIINDDMVYILCNGAFSTNIDVEFRMRKNQSNVFDDANKFTNVTRKISLSSEDGNHNLPIGTRIIMINNGNYYYYTVTGDSEEQINLGAFKSEEGTYYSEVTNVQVNMQLVSAELRKYAYEESFRFIFDFSESASVMSGEYNVAINLEEVGTITDTTKYGEETSNTIHIEDRNVSSNLTLESTIFSQNDKIDIKGTLTYNMVSLSNDFDFGKSIALVLNIFDQLGNQVQFPDGTIIKINGEEINGNVAKIIETIGFNQQRKNLNIEIDMRHVVTNNRLDSDRYKLQFNFYLADNDVLLGNIPLVTQELFASINKFEDYGIKITQVKTGTTNKEDNLQLIKDNGDVQKEVTLEYKKGNLSNNAHVLVKTYKRIQDGELNYEEIANTIDLTGEYPLTSSNGNIKSNLQFSNSLENGTYRIIYELYDGDEKLEETHINFIVNR